MRRRQKGFSAPTKHALLQWRIVEGRERAQHDKQMEWVNVASADEVPEGRVKTVTAKTTSFVFSAFWREWAAMDNHCPHQGGPLGEGSIERGADGACWGAVSWHGWDFDPLTGKRRRA